MGLVEQFTTALNLRLRLYFLLIEIFWEGNMRAIRSLSVTIAAAPKSPQFSTPHCPHFDIAPLLK
jgi:hypothetical protein